MFKNDNEIINLKNELNNANKLIEDQKVTITNLQDQINNYNNIINRDQNIINQKDLELKNLKSQLFDIQNSTTNKSIFNINEMMCVNFISSDKKIIYAIPCLKKNTFAEVEEKLYQKYPQFRETNNNFISNETQVLRFKTIEENKIGEGLPVTLIVPV